MTSGEQKRKKRRKSKAVAVLLTLFLLWYTYTQVSSGLALLIIIILIPSLAAFFILRRRRRSRAKRVLFETGVQNLDQMDGIAFERFLESLFARPGCESGATQASGDYGVDVLLRRNGKRIAVQGVHAGVQYYGAQGMGHHEQRLHQSGTRTGRRRVVRLLDDTELRRTIASASGKVAGTRPTGDLRHVDNPQRWQNIAMSVFMRCSYMVVKWTAGQTMTTTVPAQA